MNKDELRKIREDAHFKEAEGWGITTDADYVKRRRTFEHGFDAGYEAGKQELTAELKELREFVGAITVIEGKGWSISNNGNPDGLIALRQFDDRGNLLSYTHHASAIDAWRKMNAGEGE